MATTEAKLPADWEQFWADYEVMKGRSLSPRTLAGYRESLVYLGRFLEPKVPELADLAKRDIAAWLDYTHKTTSATTTALRFRGLAAVINWLANPGDDDEPYLTKNPIKGLRPPKVEEEPVQVLSLEQVRKAIAACKASGSDFESRRDEAMIRLLYDTGIRRGELVSMKNTPEALNVKDGAALVAGKTGPRIIAFTPATGAAIHRYVKLRMRRVPSSETALWIGRKSKDGSYALSGNGVYQVIARRFEQAGVEAKSLVHAFRHTAAHLHWKHGGSLDGIVASMGWKGAAMALRYGKSAAAERGREEHQRLAWAEKL